MKLTLPVSRTLLRRRVPAVVTGTGERRFTFGVLRQITLFNHRVERQVSGTLRKVLHARLRMENPDTLWSWRIACGLLKKNRHCLFDYAPPF